MSKASNNTAEKQGGLFGRLGDKLSATRRTLGDVFLGKRKLDDELLEDIESALLMADAGIEVTQAIINRLGQALSRKALKDSDAAYQQLREHLLTIISPCAQPLTIDTSHRPTVIMVVGVNGVGKTTTIGKLTLKLKQAGHSVMLAAADTFRAAAIEQLQAWGERNDVPVIAQQSGADAAAVAHDALEAAKARDIDVLIVDTAGRQHTHEGLMNELTKIRRVLNKLEAEAPHEVLMVLDATTGQNALAQVQHFRQAVAVTAVVLTKLDGTAKGGVLLAIADKTGLPIRYIGVGEALEDLRPFDAMEYINALLPADG